jgi:hypothetical protein
MQSWYASPPDVLSMLFDAPAIQKQQHLMTTLDKKLDRLADYRNLGYWIVEPHRTIDGVIHHLAQASPDLDPKSAAHRSLVMDMTWLFALSLVHTTAHLRGTFASAIEPGLSQYIFGGPSNLRDKQTQARLFRQVLGDAAGGKDGLFDVLPGYFPGLLELVTRHIRRPGLLTSALRYAEWLGLSLTAKSTRAPRVASAFGEAFDPIAGKLLDDTVRFLISAAQLNDGFLDLTELTVEPSVPRQAAAAEDGTQPSLAIE